MTIQRMRMLQRRGEESEWEAKNPILAEGEIGITVVPNGTHKFKIGDGVRRWNLLEYFSQGIVSDGVLDGSGQPPGMVPVWSGDEWTFVPIDAFNQGPTPSLATGGERTTFGDYTVHFFLESELFVVSSGILSVDVAIVAGGGSGGAGSRGVGGGGAGGIRVVTNQFVSGSTEVTVGDGATAVLFPSAGNPGENSSFGSLVANGGGFGGPTAEYAAAAGGPGGSGGGSGAGNATVAGGLGTSGQGHNGGTSRTSSSSSQRAGGGGGGAGGVGLDAALSTGGAGGPGLDLSELFGTGFGQAGYLGGGGGGGATGTNGAGGIGGGGAASASNGVSGAPNTGGGGGGFSSATQSGYSGAGGSGIVLVRYLTP
jgi:hypothetical protein